MQQVPTTSADYTPTDAETLHHIISIPLHEMVHGYSRTASTLETSSTTVPSGANKRFNQVDQSLGIPQGHLRHGDELHLEKRRMPAQSALRNSNRQRASVYLQDIQIIMQQMEDQD